MPSCRYLFYMEAQCQHFQPGVSGSQSMIAVKLHSKFPNIVWFRVNELCLSLLKWGRRPCKKVGQSDQWLSPNRNLPRKLLNVMGTSSKLRIKINQVLRQILQGFHSFICEGNFNTSGPEKIQTVTVSFEISAQRKMESNNFNAHSESYSETNDFNGFEASHMQHSFLQQRTLQWPCLPSCNPAVLTMAVVKGLGHSRKPWWAQTRPYCFLCTMKVIAPLHLGAMKQSFLSKQSLLWFEKENRSGTHKNKTVDSWQQHKQFAKWAQALSRLMKVKEWGTMSSSLMFRRR